MGLNLTTTYEFLTLSAYGLWSEERIADELSTLKNEPLYFNESGYTKPIPNYSGSWSQGGPLIEREGFCAPTRYYGCAADNPNKWQAGFGCYPWMRGPTPLIAAMRCFVASKLGEEIEIPDGLFQSLPE